MEKFKNIDQKLKEAQPLVIEAIKEKEIPYDRSEIAEYLKDKGVFTAGDDLNYVARRIFEEIKELI